MQTYAKDLVLNDCRGWITGPTVLSEKDAGPYPPGWDDGQESVSAVFMAGFDCQRFSYGPFERPVRFIFDVPGHELAAGCDKPVSEFTPYGILKSIWLTDAEIGAYFKDTLGQPVQVRPIEATEEMTGPSTVYKWNWGLEGQPTSEMTLTDSLGQGPDAPFGLRAFWFLPDGVGEMHLHFDPLSPFVGDQPAYGIMQPPMSLADDGRPFVHPSSWHSSFSATGKITLYEDWECQRPRA